MCGRGLRGRNVHDPALGKAIIGFGFVCVRSFQKRSAGGGYVPRVEPGNGSVLRNSAGSQKPASDFTSMAAFSSFFPIAVTGLK